MNAIDNSSDSDENDNKTNTKPHIHAPKKKLVNKSQPRIRVGLNLLNSPIYMPPDENMQMMDNNNGVVESAPSIWRYPYACFICANAFMVVYVCICILAFMFIYNLFMYF